MAHLTPAALTPDILNLFPIAAYVCEAPSGMLLALNDRAVELLGRRPSIGERLDTFCGSYRLFDLDGTRIERDRCPLIASLISGQECTGVDAILERPDGSRRLVSLSVGVMRDERGHTIGTVTIADDITERKGAETMLAGKTTERDADRRKDEFLAMLGHALRNPLAPMAAALQLVAVKRDDPLAVRKAHQVLGRQLAHLTRLVDDLVDVSRITRGKIELRKEQIVLSLIIRRSVDALAPIFAARGQQVHVKIAGDGATILGDHVRLEQIVMSLLTNASKYTPRGGAIHVGLDADAQWAQVIVRDNGQGISREMLPRVFDLFAQGDAGLDRDQAGLGVGLTVVRTLAELHGGVAEVASEGEGRGSEFTVRLPLAPSSRIRHVVQIPAALPRTVVARRVLVVDDNVDTAEWLAEALRIRGHDVHVAYEPQTALALAERMRPDVVMLDIGLPGMDGYAVARTLRATPATRDALLVAVTGHGLDSDRQRAFDAGFDYHFLKPVDEHCLVAVVSSGEGMCLDVPQKTGSPA